MGSVRAGRLNPKVAAWVTDIARTASDLNYELIDLADWPLPMHDEPGIPQRGVYNQQHTQAWSEKIAAADAFIFVSPQYNWGYPAALKNAIDHLFHEWKGKPAVIVTYGGHGGGKCAAQLLQVFEAIGMRVVPTMPAITITREMITGGPVNPETDFQSHAESIRQAIAALASLIVIP